MLALAGIGCGDDDGDGDDVDMFTPPVDMGGDDDDMFVEEDDMGPPETDMFVPSTVNVRIAHLIPDAPNVRVCIGPPGFAAAVPPLPSATMVPDGVPFRAVGGYTALPIGDYEARVFDADTIDEFGTGDCSIGRMDSDPDPLLTLDVNAADLTADAYYTVAAIGFVTPGDYFCPNPTPGGDPVACPAERAARLEIYEDSDVDASNALIRLLHAIPNAPNVDVCYDPDTSAGDMDPTEIFNNVAFGDATDYNMQDADLAAGSFRVYGHNPAAPDANCLDALDTGVELPIPTPAAIQVGFDELPVVDDVYATGSVHTIFAEGVFGVDPPAGADDPDNGFAAFVPLIDLPAAP